MRYLDDILIFVGVVLLGAAVFVTLGWVGIMAYVGALCLVVGMLILQREPRR